MATKNYVLGRGKVYFDPFASGTLNTTGERYLGNTPEFGLTVESESLDHFNSDEGIRVKDDSVLLELNRTGSFITDQIDINNLALFFLGSSQQVSEAGAAGETDTFTSMKGDHYYQLGVSSASPSGARKVSNVSATIDPGGTATAAVEGTDYDVDLDLGRVHIITDGGLDGVDGEFTYDIDASTRDQVVTAANATLEGAVRFVSFNPKGEKHDYYMPHIRLSPSGDFALKGDEWQQLPFDLEILKKDDTTEAIYIDGRATAS